MKPADCATREDVRREIDRIDRELVALFGERFAYIRRMAEIKRNPDEARVDWRVADVLGKVAELAKEQDLDPDLVRDLWARLLEWNIAWEREAMAAVSRDGNP